jgi:hypothetical protein
VPSWVGDIAIPLAIFVLGLIWPPLVRAWRNRRFEALVLRELCEASPRDPDGTGPRVTRTFIHRDIICRAADSAELVAGLDPTLAYHLRQLWAAHDRGGGDREERTSFVYHLHELRRFFHGNSGDDATEDPGRFFHRWSAVLSGRRRRLLDTLDTVIGRWEGATPG